MITEPPKVVQPEEATEVGNYFVSNYPPYSFWTPAHVHEAYAALDRAPAPGTPLGIYLHIPFCRKRCHFCYFKVYTDKDAGEIEGYLDTAIQELTLYSQKPFIGGRKPKFIYFGGGTPSYISTRQVTRLSLGIENFDEHILQINGRAHGAKEIDRTYDFARSIGFPQINIDLIAGMMGETTSNWEDCVRKTIALSPDSITIYQMEIPYNTTIFKEMKVMGQTVAPVADWRTKREWVTYAFAEFEKAGYTVTSAYAAVKNPARTRFLYRDMLWTGADMLGLGVASFSHVGGTHFQNEHEFESYMAKLQEGKLPIYRALTTTSEERMIRELILQMKLGRVHRAYFQNKFGIDIQQRFSSALAKLRDQGFLTVDTDCLRLNREGLLQVDRLL